MDRAEKSTILIVDDEMMTLKILSHILSPEYTVYTADNGVDAVEMAIEFQPDLILLDLIMPEMDGYEVLSTLKASDRTWKIPAIVISGLYSGEHKAKGMSYGATDYINKPFDAEIVKSKIQNQIQIIDRIRMSHD